MKTFSQTKLKIVNGRTLGKLRKVSLCEQYMELLRLREEVELLPGSRFKSSKPLRTSESDPSATNPQKN
jgi:hypothetical protein